MPYKQKRPDAVFIVRVCPVFQVKHCATQGEQESRGLYGFHQFTTCPVCEVIADGWEFWGSNGHLQFHAKTREQLLHWIKIKAREQWKTQSGGIMGYKFQRGGRIHYRAN